MKKGIIHRKRKIKENNPILRNEKIEMYRKRIQDEHYLKYAIDKIAIDLTQILTR